MGGRFGRFGYSLLIDSGVDDAMAAMRETVQTVQPSKTGRSDTPRRGGGGRSGGRVAGLAPEGGSPGERPLGGLVWAPAAMAPHSAPYGPKGAAPAQDPQEALAAGLAQLGEVLGQAGRICSELAQIRLAVTRERAVMVPVPEPQRRALLSASNVAARLGCTTSTVRRWRRAKMMPPAIVIGGVVRWEESAIEHWVAERKELPR